MYIKEVLKKKKNLISQWHLVNFLSILTEIYSRPSLNPLCVFPGLC